MYIHEIKLNSNSKFSEQFNLCSDLFGKANDELLTEEERDKYFDMFISERYRLETGHY